jgi:GT2 family glycosyltransferase
VAIPTFSREQVLLDTIAAVLRLEPAPAEILVVDQTPEHEPATTAQLEQWQAQGAIRWLRLAQPSIPKAMNVALREARSPVVLFLDDDVLPCPHLVAAHRENYGEAKVAAVVGQVLQPGEQPVDQEHPARGTGLWQDLGFRFNSTRRSEVANCIACNLSVRRPFALVVGGFDENFVSVAFRFETEFSRRLVRHGGRVVFDPRASLRHLQAPRGGTRAYGLRLRTARPDHTVGDYYFALREGGLGAVSYILWRPLRQVRTRFHLKHPWWIPVKLVSEIRGFLWALRLACRGPRYIREEQASPA